LSGSASKRDDLLTISVANVHATLPAEVNIELRAGPASATARARARVLTHEDITAHNTFDAPRTLEPVEREVELAAGSALEFPAASVNLLQVRRSEERRVGKECRSRWSADD